jgi:hypothetical protein
MHVDGESLWPGLRVEREADKAVVHLPHELVGKQFGRSFSLGNCVCSIERERVTEQ